MVDLDAIRARAEAATRGPWSIATRGDGSAYGIDQQDGYDDVIGPAEVSCMAYCYGGTSRIEAEDADWDFIAHAREDVPALLAEVERLTGANEILRRISNVNGDWNLKFMHLEAERDRLAATAARVEALADRLDARFLHEDADAIRRVLAEPTATK